jgi:hypothetical protein
MKKILLSVLMAICVWCKAQDFSAVCETGQTLYYNIIDSTTMTVGVTIPTDNWLQYLNELDGGYVIIPTTVTNEGASFIVTHIMSHAFEACNMIELVIPESIQYIASYAFETSYINKMTIKANNLIDIGSEAFCYGKIKQVVIENNVQALLVNFQFYSRTDIILKNQIPPVISENTFFNVGTIYVPQGCWYAYHDAPNWDKLSNRMYERLDGFAKVGSEWYFNKLSANSILQDYQHFIVTDTTTITVDSVDYAVSMISGSYNDGEAQYVYEEDGVVYWYNSVKNKFSTLYNFNAEVGDTWIISIDDNDYEVIVTSKQRKSWGHYAYDSQWIRSTDSPVVINGRVLSGIGFLNGLFPQVNDGMQPDSTYIKGLRCYLESDTLKYHSGILDCDQIVGWDGFNWYYEIIDDYGNMSYQHIEYTSDTTINSHRAKVLIKSNTLYDKNEIVSHEYIYEDDDVVYWWDKTAKTFTTLYDYNANIGDEWDLYVGTEHITMHVDTVTYREFNGNSYRVLTVSDANDIFSGDIICGIGHTSSFFPERLLTKDHNFRVDGIRCFWIDGEMIIKLGDVDCDSIYNNHHDVDENAAREFAVYPNPASTIVNIVGEYDQIELIDIYGKVIEIDVKNNQIDVTNLQSGMYFIKIGKDSIKFIKM